MKKDVIAIVRMLAEIEHEEELFNMSWAEFLEANGSEGDIDIDFSFKSDCGKRASRRKATAHKKESRKALRAAKGWRSDVRTDGKAKSGAIYHSDYDFRKYNLDRKAEMEKRTAKHNFERFYSADPDGNRKELEQRLISNDILINNVQLEMREIESKFRKQCEQLKELAARYDELLRNEQAIVGQLCETSWGNC